MSINLGCHNIMLGAALSKEETNLLKAANPMQIYERRLWGRKMIAHFSSARSFISTNVNQTNFPCIPDLLYSERPGI